jgi:hypothetical protein
MGNPTHRFAWSHLPSRCSHVRMRGPRLGSIQDLRKTLASARERTVNRCLMRGRDVWKQPGWSAVDPRAIDGPDRLPDPRQVTSLGHPGSIFAQPRREVAPTIEWSRERRGMPRLRRHQRSKSISLPQRSGVTPKASAARHRTDSGRVLSGHHSLPANRRSCRIHRSRPRQPAAAGRSRDQRSKPVDRCPQCWMRSTSAVQNSHSCGHQPPPGSIFAQPRRGVAPRAGLEPATKRLTVACSTN